MNKEFNIGDIVRGRYFDQIDRRAHNGFIVAISGVTRRQYRIRLFEPINSFGCVWIYESDILMDAMKNE